MTKEGKAIMKRKILVMILALLLCVSLCACGSYRANDNRMDDAATRENTDMMPDAKDGYVDDDSGTDGILNGDLSMPSPNVSHRP